MDWPGPRKHSPERASGTAQIAGRPMIAWTQPASRILVGREPLCEFSGASGSGQCAARWRCAAHASRPPRRAAMHARPRGEGPCRALQRLCRVTRAPSDPPCGHAARLAHSTEPPATRRGHPVGSRLAARHATLPAACPRRGPVWSCAGPHDRRAGQPASRSRRAWPRLAGRTRGGKRHALPGRPVTNARNDWRAPRRAAGGKPPVMRHPSSSNSGVRRDRRCP